MKQHRFSLRDDLGFGVGRLEGFVARRRHLARLYEERLAPLAAVEINDPGPDGSVSAYHLFGILLDFEALGTTRAAVMQGLRERSIGTQVHYIPVPAQPYYRDLGYDPAPFTGAAEYESHTTSMLSSPVSAVAMSRRSAVAHVQLIELQWPCSSFCVFELRS